MRMAAVVLAGALAFAAPAAAQDAARDAGWRWTTAWTASAAPARFDGTPEAPLAYTDQTIRQDIRIPVRARSLRIRISNELGLEPLRLDRMTAGGSPVTFGGQGDVTLAPGVTLLSDPVAMDVGAGGLVTVQTHVPDTARGVVRRTPVRLGAGAVDVSEASRLERRQGFVSAVFVETAEDRAVVVALGDSITEGATATLGAELDWPSVLGRRLEAACPGDFIVVNAGISGNQVVRDGRSPNVRARLDRDVLSLPGVTHVILIEGINDIRHNGDPASPGRDPQEVEAGYGQVAARLRLHDVRVLGGTLTPFAGSERFDERSEASRQTLNAAIRSGRLFDGVVDFDAAVRDPANPQAMAEGTHRDDRLHPNDEGYRRMAEVIDLSLLGCNASRP